jgi:hypothetical protein
MLSAEAVNRRTGSAMRKHPALIAAIAAAIMVAAASAVLAQPAPPAPQAAAPAAPAPAVAAAPYPMTMGDMMNTLVQPRHAKLGLAGQAQNWPLAGYAVVEIRQAFAGIAKALPKFRGYPVGELADAALSQPLNALQDAIRLQDPQKFAVAYGQLTAGCNACHATLFHPFVVIKAPDASAFPNQKFSPGQ